MPMRFPADLARLAVLRQAIHDTGWPNARVDWLELVLKKVHDLGWDLFTRGVRECHDCGEKWPSPYMVYDHVWHQAWPEYELLSRRLQREYLSTIDQRKAFLLLCFSCLEKKLGRDLVAEDFNMALPINWGIRKGLAMRSG